MIKVDRAIGPTADSSIFRDVGIVLSRHGVRGATAFDGLTAHLLSTVASIGGIARREAVGIGGRVLLAPARRTWPYRAGESGQGSETGNFGRCRGALLGAILQHNSPDNSAGRGWVGNGPGWNIMGAVRTVEVKAGVEVEPSEVGFLFQNEGR